MARYKDDLERLSTVDLGKTTQTGNADFFILLSGGAREAAKVDAVRFVSGDEKLKSYADALRTADYHLTFPDDTPVKILRRGTLSCSVTTGSCKFVMTLPEDVRTVTTRRTMWGQPPRLSVCSSFRSRVTSSIH